MIFKTTGRRPLMLGALAMASLGADAVHAASVIPMDIVNERCVVRVLMDGRPASMLLDTGAERSVVTRAAMMRLDLQPDQWVATTLVGAGGMAERHADAVVGVARLGGVTLVQRASGGGLSMAVTSADLGGVDGLLGGDVLRHATIYLDMPRRRLLLFPPAPTERGGVRLQSFRNDLLLAPVRLEGHDLVALLDTGASASLINARGLHRLGLPAESLEHDPGLSSLSVGGALPVRAHRFRELCLGPLNIERPVLMIAGVPEPAFDITLGLDVLGTRPLLLSYAALELSFNAG